MRRSKPNLEWIRALLGDLDNHPTRAADSSDTIACALTAPTPHPSIHEQSGFDGAAKSDNDS